jgi:hypothetical protein
MKITSSDIAFQSTHTKLELNQKQENLQAWVGHNPGQPAGEQSGVILNISEKAFELQKSASSTTNPLDEDLENALSDKDKQKLLLLEKLMEQLTGKKFKFRIPKAIRLDEGTQPIQISQGSVTPRAGWGLSYDSISSHYESEKVSFSSKGTILTSDGRSLSIDLTLNMSREFMSRQELHIRAGDAVMKDPLVINFDAPLHH